MGRIGHCARWYMRRDSRKHLVAIVRGSGLVVEFNILSFDLERLPSRGNLSADEQIAFTISI